MQRHGKSMRAVAALALVFALSASCAQQAPPAKEASVCPPAAQDAAAPSALADLRAKAEQEGKVRVIVRLASASPAGAQLAMGQAQTAALTSFEEAGVKQAAVLSERLPFIVAEVTPEQLDAMYSDPNFDSWMEDRIAFPTLAESGPLVQAPQLQAAGGRGQGQAVAILDTGVDSTHPFLGGRVKTEACFSTTSSANASTSVCPNGQSSQIGAGAARPCPADGCEHGTHVAGIAAGKGADFSGMAPDAEIVAVQVFSMFRGAACGGQPSPCVASFTSDQIRGLDFVLQQAPAHHIAAVNMSLGGGRSTTYCDDDLTKPVIDQLRAAGVAVAIAAGNDGYRDSVSFPGCISTAVTVGATTKDDQVASFSNCGPQVDLHAPGVNITSSVPGGGFAAFSGTSMATPHVTGAFAAIRSLRPTATVDQIEAALKSTGLDVGGRPRIRLLDAANALGHTAATATEGAMAAEPAGADAPQGIAELAALPADQPVRLIVQVKTPAGAQGQAVTAAVSSAEQAARAAGVTHVERMGSQPMLTIEATPAQARALAASGTVASVQQDSTAHTQH
jgi:subtilisin family serine protease